MFLFLEHLQDLSKLQHVVVQQLMNGLPVTRQVKNKYILNSRRIKMSTDQLSLGLITMKDFLIQCAHVVDGYLNRESNWTTYIENQGK